MSESFVSIQVLLAIHTYCEWDVMRQCLTTSVTNYICTLKCKKSYVSITILLVHFKWGRDGVRVISQQQFLKLLIALHTDRELDGLIQVLLAIHLYGPELCWDFLIRLSITSNTHLLGVRCENFISVTVLLAILTDQQWDMVRAYLNSVHI